MLEEISQNPFYGFLDFHNFILGLLFGKDSFWAFHILLFHGSCSGENRKYVPKRRLKIVPQ